MKKEIHPKYFEEATITCACGESYNVGSTEEKISVELCANCHPFYTGKQKIVDSGRRVERFEKLQKRHKELAKEKTPKKETGESSDDKEDDKETEEKEQTDTKQKSNEEVLKKVKDSISKTDKQ